MDKNWFIMTLFIFFLHIIILYNIFFHHKNELQIKWHFLLNLLMSLTIFKNNLGLKNKSNHWKRN